MLANLNDVLLKAQRERYAVGLLIPSIRTCYKGRWMRLSHWKRPSSLEQPKFSCLTASFLLLRHRL